MSKAIITVPVPDGHTSQRFFEVELGDLDLRIVDGTILLVSPGEVVEQAFGPGQWSRVEFSHGE